MIPKKYKKKNNKNKAEKYHGYMKNEQKKQFRYPKPFKGDDQDNENPDINEDEDENHSENESN